jgi:DNA repair exonuclease SbcCD nuclease subunit
MGPFTSLRLSSPGELTDASNQGERVRSFSFMRFLHAADLHLGLRVTRFGSEVNRRIQEARFEALDNLVAAAKERAVDFVVIAGDLFDDNHVDATVSRRAFELLGTLPMPVYVLPGNHDPLTPDSVWERPPWNQANDGLLVLRRPEPVAFKEGVTLLPCPLYSKTSLDDPTAWLPPRPAGDLSIRIGVGHGSLRDRPNLPEDDHLIDRQVADSRRLDYLALGHWHKTLYFADQGKVNRTAYCGVHEPMRFPGEAKLFLQIGWTPYSRTTESELFADDGKGKVLLVEIGHSGAAPAITPLEVGKLEWRDEAYDLHDEAGLSRVIEQLARRPSPERQLLRLRLRGVLDARAYLRLDELEGSPGTGGILSRYFWSDLDKDHLLLEPTAEQTRDIVGEGVLRRVFECLNQELASETSEERELAKESLITLYRLAQDCHPCHP